MMYTTNDMETYYRIKLLGLIKSVEGIGNVDFSTDIDSGETTVTIDHADGIIERNVSFISDIRAMESFVQDAIKQYIKS